MAGPRRIVAWTAGVAAVLAVLAPGPAPAASFDTEAPANAPPHWLPPEPWVYNHWLPYDEGRLYRLLQVSRGDVWRQLRDDRHTLAQLAAVHGWPQPGRLASALVAPWRGHVGAGQLRVLRSRALRTLTQGHLAQHLFFHSLHQFAIPSEAPAIFGVSDAEFRDLRRRELSPLAIGALHGRSPARIEALSIRVLRERFRAGVHGHETTARQARLLLGRQISQLPRWLGQERYNGPPKTHQGELVSLPSDYARNPSISEDGREVTYEAYRQQLPLAVSLGEIAVVTRDLGTGAATVVSHLSRPSADGLPQPTSAYNPTVSGDGRLVAYESAAGNQNFAKRYGRIQVFLSDAATGAASLADDRPLQPRVSRSAYNPVLSRDGRRLAFQAVENGVTGVYVRDLGTRAITLASRGLPPRPRGGYRDVFEPALSGDGRVVAFTAIRGTLRSAGAGTSSVYVRELARGRTVRVSGRRFASDPAVSADGRWVAYATTSPRGGAVMLRDLRRGRTLVVARSAASAYLSPRVSSHGEVVAFAEVTGGISRVLAYRRATGRTVLVSRAGGRHGAAAGGTAGDPAISGDGRRVAFVSDAANLSPLKTDSTRAVFVRDLRAATTRLVSAPRIGADAGLGRLRLPVAPLPEPAPGATVAITDNAFVDGVASPVLHVRRGQAVTWSWQSQESHNVGVRAGPATFQAPTRTAGRFSHRFARAGTYTLQCSLHAPGMTMRVVVS